MRRLSEQTPGQTHIDMTQLLHSHLPSSTFLRRMASKEELYLVSSPLWPEMFHFLNFGAG